MKGIRAVDFTTAEYPRVGYDEAALAALSKMLGEERDYAMVVEQGDIVGVLERKELVFLYGRGELDGSTLVSRVARDLRRIDREGQGTAPPGSGGGGCLLRSLPGGP